MSGEFGQAWWIARRPLVSALVLMAVLLAWNIPGVSQSGVAVRSPGKWGLANPFAEAMGDRFWTAGKESVVMTGTITDAQGAGSVQITMQLPGLWRIDRTSGGSSRTVGFNGAIGWVGGGTLTASDEDLLETLADDSAEAFLNAVASGNAYWLVGRNVQVRTAPNVKPTEVVHVFGTLRPARQRKAAALREKFYHFNTSTQLLSRVVYQTESKALVETSFSGWQKVNGQMVPTVWTRKEGGKEIFTLRIAALEFAAGTSDKTQFQPR